jgi:bacterial/archaeal transporter family protein
MAAWWIYALLSAFFAALTTLFAKSGLKGIDSDLATAVRTGFVLILAWAIVFARGQAAGVTSLSRRTLVFLALSALGTGLSWLCYFRALQAGEAGPVSALDKSSLAMTVILAALFLGERLTFRTGLGTGLILAGILILAW